MACLRALVLWRRCSQTVISASIREDGGIGFLDLLFQAALFVEQALVAHHDIQIDKILWQRVGLQSLAANGITVDTKALAYLVH